ncbi:MAG TPA: kelch repeat-containing protein [Candidatus Limnocylindrales bacterium]|nr:kelch repeat-containing protein [Candidatus Limnocylindrales bacterium]
MSERLDAAIWSGLQQRLAGVEALIPEAPPWRPMSSVELHGQLRLGSAFRRPSATARPRRQRLVLALLVTGVVLALVAAALFGGARQVDTHLMDGPFGPYGMYRPSDHSAHAAVLEDGRVLIVTGGWLQMGEVAARRADIWDPVSGRGPTGRPAIGRVASTATLLLDGRVLVVGGFDGPFAYGANSTASAEIWDPATGAFRETGWMASPRVGHTATMLADGRVLITGGTGPGGAQATAELWDPATEEFSPAGEMVGARTGSLATLLPDGTVQIWGGGGPSQLWRPAYNNFVSAGLLDRPSFATATRLLDGRVLLTQGREPGANYTLPPAVLDTDRSSTSQASQFTVARTGYAATLLSDGRVLITGGVSPAGDVLSSVEVWDPADAQFRLGRPLPRPVANHTALLLTDGRLLIVFNAFGPQVTGEPIVYEPEPLR